MDVGKIGLGTLMLVVSTTILAASGTVSTPVPLYALVLAPLGLAVAATLVEKERRPA